MKEMYIFSRAFLLILNFSTRSKLSLCHAVLVMLFMCSVQLQLFASVKKGKRKVQGVPQSQTAALPRPQEEEKTDKSKQAQTEQTYEKH